MWGEPCWFVIAFCVAAVCSNPVHSDTNKLNGKGDAAPQVSSVKSTATDSKKDDAPKFAAPISEQEQARTHNTWRPHFYGGQQYQQYQQYQPGRILPQNPFGHIQYVQNKLPAIPFPFQLKPQPVSPPTHPVFISSPPIAVPSVEQPIFQVPSKPVVPYYPLALSKPVLPPVNKPSFAVTQQIIHTPVITEKVEVIRRPVISEMVHVVHKPIVREEQQVIKIPTYAQHVVKKPIFYAVKNEVSGTPIRLPSQHYDVHDRPEHIQTAPEILQLPYQHIPSHGGGSVGFGSSYGSLGYGSNYGSIGYGSSYGTESAYKPGYLGSGLGLGGVSTSYGVSSAVPSYSTESAYKPGYLGGYGLGGVGTSYGMSSAVPSYTTVGSSIPSYATVGSTASGVHPSYGFGSGYVMGSGYEGADYNGVAQTFMEPAASCKHNECSMGSEEVAYPDSQPTYVQPVLYNSQPPFENQPALYARESALQFDQDGLIPSAYGYFLEKPVVAQPPSEEYKLPTDPASMKKLAELIWDALGSREPSPSSNGMTGEGKPQGKSNEETSDEVREAEKVEHVMNDLKSVSLSSLKEIETRLDKLQKEIMSGAGSTTKMENKQQPETTKAPISMPEGSQQSS